MWHVRKSHEQGWRWWPWGEDEDEDEDEGENEDDDDDDDDGDADDADVAAAADDDDGGGGVVMWWCGSKFKLSKGNNRSDRKAKVGSLEFLAFRVGVGLFCSPPTTELAYPMCWKVMFRSKWA